MTIASTRDFVELIRAYRLLDGAELQELQKLAGRCSVPRALAGQALSRNLLTPFQVNQLFLGRAAELVLDHYILLERLGEGAMGQVYKVRHRLMRWEAALKVIHKQHIANTDVLRRFSQEIQALAQLSHPNIVYEFDAGKAGDTYFFVMEYVEGVNLRQLVRTCGPLSWPRAVDYIHQAGQGLQHAHDSGMIHRDIKPANLLRTTTRPAPIQRAKQHVSRPLTPPAHRGPSRAEVVKIFDLGLSRLLAPPDAAHASATLTHANVFIGTPDFVAPEQAQSPHSADIRSDLYSLGCTLYFLLTGQLPFPEGTPLEKLIRHCQEEPMALEKLRPDLPADLAEAARRLMAKKPAHRFQTPAELCAALVPLLSPELAATAPVMQEIPMALSVDSADSEQSSKKFFGECFSSGPDDGRIIRQFPAQLTQKMNPA